MTVFCPEYLGEPEQEVLEKVAGKLTRTDTRDVSDPSTKSNATREFDLQKEQPAENLEVRFGDFVEILSNLKGKK